MRAVLADLSLPRYLLTAAAQHLPLGLGRNAGWGWSGMLSLRDDVPAPVRPEAPGWVLLRPELSGICGSDVALAHAKSSRVLSAYYGAREQIPGHETQPTRGGKQNANPRSSLSSPRPAPASPR